MMEISTPENMMFVVGATKADKLKEIRQFCPDNFSLCRVWERKAEALRMLSPTAPTPKEAF